MIWHEKMTSCEESTQVFVTFGRFYPSERTNWTFLLSLGTIGPPSGGHCAAEDVQRG